MSEGNELLDVVDLNNKVIGQAVRGKVFKKGLLHRAANIFIFNSKGQVYLQKRSKNKLKYPLFWDMSAGEHPKAGESIEEAALRGVKEELGILVQLKKVLDLHHMVSGSVDSNDHMVDNELVETYQGIFDGEIKVNSDEISEAKFFSVQEVNEMIKNPDNKFTSWFLEDWKLLKESNII